MLHFLKNPLNVSSFTVLHWTFIRHEQELAVHSYYNDVFSKKDVKREY